jgi:plastocyanin
MRAACGLTLVLAAGVLAADDKPAKVENPYRDAKVGDWIEWKTNDVVMRHTVTARTEAKLTLRIDQTVGGKKGPPLEQAIDLKGPYPPVAKKDPEDETKTVVEKLGSGKETLTIGGKKYDCEWTKNKTTITFKGGTEFVSVSTVWHCKDVPLGGAVRTESVVGGKTHVTELSGFERGK